MPACCLGSCAAQSPQRPIVLRMTTEPRHCGNRLQDEDGEIQDFIVDEEEDDDEEAVGAARKPAARRRMALSDDEDD